MRLTILTVAVLLLGLQGYAQGLDTTRTVLYGTCRNEFGSVLQNTYVLLKGSPWGTTTDSAGTYRIDITSYLTMVPEPTVEFQYLGYKYVQYKPAKDLKGEVQYDLKFYEHDGSPGPYTDPRKKHKKKDRHQCEEHEHEH